MSAFSRKGRARQPRARYHASAAGLESSSTVSPTLDNVRHGYRGGIGFTRPAVIGLAKLLMLPLASAAPLGLWQRSVKAFESDEDLPKSPDEPQLWIYLSVAVALVLLGGAFAGLTIALMGQDETYLQVMATSGEGSERKNAKRVLKLLKKGKHWVLVTLLLSNVITNETLPIVLDRSLGGGWPAVLSSTVLIVIFGEIAPQSVCVRYGLSIGAYMAPFVLTLMYIMFPVAWPTAKLLDYLLGEDHGTMYKKAGLKTLVQLHKSLGTAAGERLMEDEVNIINSVLDLKEKPVGNVMTPMQDVFTMSADTVLDERMMDTILSQGYSRIPIYTPDNTRNFIGMLLVKILITYDPEDCMRVRDFSLATLPETSPETSCLDIINFFQEGKSHMVLVSDFPGSDRGALGVITLEDVIEELIGEEIIDESDVFVDVHKAIRRAAPAPAQRYKHSTDDPQSEVSESEREGKDGEDAPLLSKVDSRKSTQANGSSMPGTTFLMRRKSSTASDATRDTTKPMMMRSGTTDFRQHLKHLGPSNAASKPRATKYTSVKIKPAVGTIPEGQATTTGTDGAGQGRSLSEGPPDTENTSLLNPSAQAGPAASGGAAALQARYGGTDTASPLRTVRSPSADRMSAREASRLAQEHTTSPPAAGEPSEEPPRTQEDRTDSSSLRVPDKMVVGANGETDTVGELQTPIRDRSKPRRTARSGSITETTVNAGGMKKVVLETTSSSSSVDETNGNGESPSRSKGSLLDVAEDAAEEERDGEAGGGGSGEGAKVAKKRKKRGKKKKGGNGE